MEETTMAPQEKTQVRITGRAGTQGEGPFLYIHVALDGELITEASYETYGCPTAMRCGDWITQWIRGRTCQAVGVIEPHDLILVLGGIPLGKEHCAELAVEALRDALRQISEIPVPELRKRESAEERLARQFL